jgi:hypothetical protein
MAYEGENISVSEREMKLIERAYPKLSVLQIIRQADLEFPRRKDQKMPPKQFLERILGYRQRDADGAKREEAQDIDDGGPLGAVTGGRWKGPLPRRGHEPGIGYFKDMRFWWRHYGVQYLELGMWDTPLCGPVPWLPGTKVPEGLFTTDELLSLRRKFDAINDERLTRGGDSRSRQGGQPQGQVSTVQSFAEAQARQMPKRNNSV